MTVPPGLWRITAGLSGFLAVAAGAWAAHGLAPEAARLVDKAAQYQLVHAAALLAVHRLQGRWGQAAGGFFVAGIVLFCGSLYGLALTGWPGFTGTIPVGGVAFLLGWLCLLPAV